MMSKMLFSYLSAALILSGSLAAQAEEGFSVSSWAKSAKLETVDTNALAKKVINGSQSSEQALLTKARAAFAKDNFDAAIELYNQIPKGSDHWLEAVEEKGWAFHRKKDFEKALSQTKTLVGGPFVGVIGSEPFFLQSLSQLKVCDYKSILETHKLFKETQKGRIGAIQSLAETGTSQAFEKVLEKADRFPIGFSQFGEEAKSLPRLFFRDVEFQKNLLAYRLADVGAKQLQSQDELTAAQYKQIQKLEKQALESKTKLMKRMKALALAEHEENFKILQKINLLEVETIQRVHADQKMDLNSYNKGKFSETNADTLVFPDDGRPWMDELDKYQYQVNACPQNIRRKM